MEAEDPAESDGFWTHGTERDTPRVRDQDRRYQSLRAALNTAGGVLHKVYCGDTRSKKTREDRMMMGLCYKILMIFCSIVKKN